MAQAISSQCTSFALPKVKLELTNQCNLRCAYCFQRNASPAHMSDGLLNTIRTSLKKLGTASIELSGNGELTTCNRWESTCHNLMEDGFLLSTITNFAKPLSDSEIKLLGGFESIMISCDTMDSDLFYTLRKGAKLESIINNIRRLKALQDSNVRLTFSSIVTEKTIWTMPCLVKEAIAIGISGFYFRQLDLEPNSTNTKVKPVGSLSGESLKKASRIFFESLEYIESKGCQHTCMPPLLDQLKDRLPSSDNKNIIPNITRDCLDPWSYAYIDAHGEVRPCCYHGPVGSLKNDSLETALKGEKMEKLRTALLTGELNHFCSNCPERSTTDTDSLKRKVDSIVALSKTVGDLVTSWTNERKRVLVYGAGEHTSMLLKSTTLSKAPLVGFCDSNPSMQNKKILNFNVIGPNEIESLLPDVILISSKALDRQIKKHLEDTLKNKIELVSLY